MNLQIAINGMSAAWFSMEMEFLRLIFNFTVTMFHWNKELQ
jgi:hypothetical protein